MHGAGDGHVVVNPQSGLKMLAPALLAARMSTPQRNELMVLSYLETNIAGSLPLGVQ